jgi:HEPN domain-containing protein
MATRRELQRLACLRLKEAEALFTAGCYDACAYLCGYVVELGMKAVICARFGVNEYPEKRLHGALRTHELEDLKLVAGLDQAFSSTIGRIACWSVASEWKPERRYQQEGSYDQAAALRMLSAISSYPDGVLACISSHW